MRNGWGHLRLPVRATLSARKHRRATVEASMSEGVFAVSTPLPLLVQARDPVSQAGVVAELDDWPEVRVVDDAPSAEVAIVVTDEVDDETVRMLKALQRTGCTRVVLVVTRIDDAGLVT